MLFYNLLNLIASFTGLFVLVLIYYVFRAIQAIIIRNRYTFDEWFSKIGEEFSSFGKYVKITMVVVLLAEILTNTAIHQFVGIHNLKLKPEGTYCFYVEATKNKGKTYTLPAQIRIEKKLKM